jgi:hypothetical protein
MVGEMCLCFIAYKFGTMSVVMLKKKKEKKSRCRESSIARQLDGGLLFYSE